MPIDDASSAHAAKPRSAKSCSAFCSVTGSGVVRPVERIAASAAAAGTPLASPAAT